MREAHPRSLEPVPLREPVQALRVRSRRREVLRLRTRRCFDPAGEASGGARRAPNKGHHGKPNWLGGAVRLLSAATKAKFARTQTEGYAVCVRVALRKASERTCTSNKYRCEHPFSLQICARKRPGGPARSLVTRSPSMNMCKTHGGPGFIQGGLSN